MGKETKIEPVPIDLKKESVERAKDRLRAEAIIDTYEEQLEELFLIRNPQYRFGGNYSKELEDFKNAHRELGNWFHFPWSKLLIHYLPDEMHQELRTARNRNLITKKEQEKFYDMTISIAGLSIGSHVALTIAMMGGAKVMHLADPDELSPSNVNRVRGDFSHVGSNKTFLVANQIYQLNPYTELHLYPEGITEGNIDAFLSSPQSDLLIEETDSLELKIKLRLKAREFRIPTIMATDNGDNVIVDVERYDLHPDLELFNGITGKLTLEEFKSFSPEELPKLAAKIAGPHLAVPRMLASVLEVGKTLYSWPQLGSAATLSGVIAAYIARKIALGEKVREGKFEVNLDLIIDTNYSAEERSEKRNDFLKKMGLNRE